MNALADMLRLRLRWALALPALLLLAGLVVGAVHHHDDGPTVHPCAVCTASHAPAIDTVERATLEAPARWSERVVCVQAESRPSRSLRGHHGRAPPQA